MRVLTFCCIYHIATNLTPICYAPVSADQKSRHRGVGVPADGFTGLCWSRTTVFIWHSRSSKLTGCGQNSFFYRSSTEALIFLLDFGLELFSATGSCLQFLAMWSPWAVHKRGVCSFPGQMDHISLISSSVTTQRKVSALKKVLAFRLHPPG